VTTLRLVLGGAAAAAVVGFTAGLLDGDDELVQPAAAAAPARTVLEPPTAEPLPPAIVPDAERPRVPAAILSRAATARALDRRGPACPPREPPRPAREEPPRCAPEQRESIEIDWHGAPRKP
jgi:hypothetical protein